MTALSPCGQQYLLAESKLMFEFHISRGARDLYRFEEPLFTITGNVIFGDFQAARRFADRMNEVRNVRQHPELAVSASDIYAMGLIDEILHYMVEQYRRSVKPTIISEAYSWVREKVDGTDQTLLRFTEIFPPVKVYRGEEGPDAYLAGETEAVPNRHISLEELIMLALANENPAFTPYIELFDDQNLKTLTRYTEILKNLEDFFRNQPIFGPYGQTLLDLLRAPAKASPNSLYGQLEYIRTHWGHILKDLLMRILGGMDFIREERKPRFFGPGPALAPRFGARDLAEPERFSPDLDWMPHLVLIAKSTYVWLYQLSVKYGRTISRLDEIPDEELESLARWGFTGLWLIGVWERSPASRKIKQLTGNPEAASSAYSIYDYTIAADLGGHDAFENLKGRAYRYGIRMATDMVPNHMGLYSKWTIEHPDWFIQLREPPFPSYRFTGPNLSEDERVVIQIEDGYWNRTDAAVVFKRYDSWTGDTRYIYHGNDGTSTPWNDTAQLDFLKSQVREAVIAKTVEVARLFPIIRFDAAMTLAKRHFQRLWYPLPGYGGDIPSRAGHSVSQEEFDRLFPEEFWRELVDRVAVEAPNTLLLAEAFWLMEGYFVRSLGMHRVYNSAFMNMLKTEDNSKYRDVMKNILRFNPEILKRFVNFMNNPDEEPAVVQFGKGDKYFGVATIMATLPGLPMFGHGQIEGFGEKYGMEYRRSYWDEGVDTDLVARHEREIFPLFRKRYLFSEVDNFVLYDVVTEEGHVNEDVFAFSNMAGDERALVVYNNRYAEARGFVRRSVGMNIDTGGGRRVVHRSLGEGLKLSGDENAYYILEDFREGLQYLRSGRTLCTEGLQVHLGAFKSNMFTNFAELRDTDGQVRRLFDYLGGRGVPDVMSELQELYLKNILDPFRAAIGKSMLLNAVRTGRNTGQVPDSFLNALAAFLKETREYLYAWLEEMDVNTIVESVNSLLHTLFNLDQLKTKRSRYMASAVDYLSGRIPAEIKEDLSWWRIPMLWVTVARIGAMVEPQAIPIKSRALMDELLLSKAMKETLMSLGLSEGGAEYELTLVKVLVSCQGWGEEASEKGLPRFVGDLFADPDVKALVGINEFGGRLWFNKESFEHLLYWLFTVTVIRSVAFPLGKMRVSTRVVLDNYGQVITLLRAAEDANYDVDAFVERLEKIGRAT
jgi:glycosidase